MTVDTVTTLVDTGAHTQPPVSQSEIRLVDTVDTYSRKNYWGSKAATRPVAGSAEALQWGKGSHRIHLADKGNDYSALQVSTSGGRWTPVPRAERSRCYRRSRGSPLSYGNRGEALTPMLAASEKISNGKPDFPEFTGVPAVTNFPVRSA